MEKSLARKNNLILFILLVLFSEGYSQYNGILQYGIPPAPDVASMFKAVERPIGTFTGTTPIDIPIYSAKSRDLSIPLSLSYNNSGIKVEELASNVGLGWSLGGTFVVSRSVRGIADDNPGGFIHNTVKPSNFILSQQSADLVLKNQSDLQPDIFYFSINGKSGKFFFKESGEIVQISQSGVDIKPIFNGPVPGLNEPIRGWLIRDENGTCYYFGDDRNRTKSFVSESHTIFAGSQNKYPNYNTWYYATWHLAEITDHNGTSLCKYDYTKNPMVDFATRSTAATNLQKPPFTGPAECQNTYPNEVEAVMTVYNDEYVVKNICAGEDSIQFYSSGRLDCNFKKLDSVRVFSRDNALKKRYVLQYDYFDNVDQSIPDHRRKRLKLLSFSEKSIISNDSICTKFNYDATQLPERFSNSIDYWGYYNTFGNTNTTIPNGKYTFYGSTLNITDKADRRPNMGSVAGTLTKISFPTGGTREFFYENNDAKNNPQNQIWMPNGPGGPYTVLFDSIKTPQFSPASETPPQPPSFLKQFQLAASSEFRFTLFGAPCSGTSYKVRIYKIVSGSETLVQSFEGTLSGNLTLDAGTYVLKFYFDNTCHFVRVLGEKGIPASEAPITIGGIRVKEIKDFDPVSNNYYSTTYRYRKFSDLAITSGELVSPVIVAAPNAVNNPCNCVVLISQSHYPLIADGGSYVVYPQVSTIETGKGRRDVEYSYFPDGTNETQYTVPFSPPQDLSSKRGKIIAEKIYNEAGALISKNVTVYPATSFAGNDTWDYDFPMLGDMSIPAMLKMQQGLLVSGSYNTHYSSARLTYQPCDDLVEQQLPCGISNKSYSNVSNFYAPSMYIQTTYTASGRIDNRVDYSYYTDIGRPILKKETHYLNNNQSKEITYKYAFNNLSDFTFSVAGEVKDALLQRNVLQPLEVITAINKNGNSVFIDGFQNEYAFINNPELRISAQKRFTTLTDFTAQNYSRYDNFGNILETFRSNNVKEVYLYGYKNQYPVAKITGSDWNTVNSVVTQDQINAATEIVNNDAAVRTLLNNLRTNTATKNAFITTYTYSPLTGRTSETDANGKTIFYEYDGLGRLQRIRDQDNNVIKTFDYKYQAQQ
jgi:YD repeat-containing protein